MPEDITRILVCGGRDYSDRDILEDFLDACLTSWHFKVLIHGDARGADRLSHEWALKRGVQPAACRANWPRQGNAAGIIRNYAMLLLQPQMCISFPGGRGTADMVRQCHSAHIEVRHVPARPDYVFKTG